MTFPVSVGNLVASVNQLTAETNVPKSTLDAKVAQAEAETPLAQAQQALAEGYRATTSTHAADAATHLATVKAGVTYQGIAAILASKAVTAVDVFVYDTSLDSDGGAWRKRCQHTSWYNEPLNTATRGARREFPAVAVIVVEALKITIYDGDDPTLPMWMVLAGVNSSGNLPWAGGGSSFSGVYALNGTLAISSFLNNGLAEVRFLADTGYVRNLYSAGFYNGNIAQRHATLGYTFSGLATDKLVSQIANDVAMTVLPDAPVDPATGLPVPTIAVATAAGVSVIRDDLIVVDSASTLNSHQVLPVAEGLWYGGNSGLQLHFATWGDIRAGDGFGDQVADNTAGGNRFDLQARVFHGLVAAKGALAWGTNSGASGTAFPGLQLRAVNFPDQLKGMSAFLTSEFNTGWLPGDIKGAFLSSTDTASLVGSELVTNGTFDTDLTGWGGDAVWDAGAAKLDFDAVGSNAYLAQTITGLTAGATYLLQWNQTYSGTGVDRTRLRLRNAANNGDLVFGYYYNSGLKSVYFVADGAQAYFALWVENAGTIHSIDNISVRRADADRSVNNKGLVVNGTITRSPVATGAELVAYSGFSAANYLEQPYNSALDFGTGDFCVMGWHKSTGSNNNADIFARTTLAPVVDDRIIRLTRWALGRYSFGVSRQGIGGDGVEYQAGNITHWAHIVCIRRGGTLELWIDGRLVASGPSATDASQPGAVFRLGHYVYSLNGSSALWRISATAPTADQIRRIYEDERKLFQPGAQCTLYGTSDAVTALAHDPKTNLLHVGTSAGRSTFDGLVRVANTTTPVATAISAVNGLIAEQ